MFYTQGHKGLQHDSYGHPTSSSMKGAQNDNHLVKIMRMSTQLFIIYDPSKAASQSNHHMQRALQSACECLLSCSGGRTQGNFPSSISSAVTVGVWRYGWWAAIITVGELDWERFLSSTGLKNNMGSLTSLNEVLVHISSATRLFVQRVSDIAIIMLCSGLHCNVFQYGLIT